MIFTILHLPIYQDYGSNTVGSVSRSYLFLYHCCKIALSKDLKDVKGDMSHAKNSWESKKLEQLQMIQSGRIGLMSAEVFVRCSCVS